MPQLESGVPTPPSVRTVVKYPFKHMNVGDSFFITADTAKLRQTVASAAGAYKLNHTGWGYVTRVVSEKGVSGVRVWCTALHKVPVVWHIDADYAPDLTSSDGSEGGWSTFRTGRTEGLSDQEPQAVLDSFKTEFLPVRSMFRLYMFGLLVAETDGRGGVVHPRPLPSNVIPPLPLPPAQVKQVIEP